jgi:hypothetical protein
MKIVQAATAVSLAFALGGCATVLRGTKQDLSLQSTPPGATATLTTGETCVTPCELHLPRKLGFEVTFELEGYAPTTAHVSSQWSRGGTQTFIIGNIIAGGAIGMGVDASNGATRDLTPNPVTVTLQPVGSTPVVAEAAPMTEAVAAAAQ